MTAKPDKDTHTCHTHKQNKILNNNFPHQTGAKGTTSDCPYLEDDRSKRPHGLCRKTAGFDNVFNKVAGNKIKTQDQLLYMPIMNFLRKKLGNTPHPQLKKKGRNVTKEVRASTVFGR